MGSSRARFISAGKHMLGEDGVVAALSGAHELSAPALARRLRSVVSEYAREPTRDDLAILVLRSRPPAG